MNRINLANKNSAYKSYEAKLRRRYRRQEGAMIQTLIRVILCNSQNRLEIEKNRFSWNFACF